MRAHEIGVRLAALTAVAWAIGQSGFAQKPALLTPKDLALKYFECFRGLTAPDEKHSYSHPLVPILKAGTERLYPLPIDDTRLFLFLENGEGRTVVMPPHQTGNEMSALGATSYKLALADKKPVFLNFRFLPHPNSANTKELLPDELAVRQTEEPAAQMQDLTWQNSTVDGALASLRGEVVKRVQNVRATYEANLLEEDESYNDHDPAHYVAALDACATIPDISLRGMIRNERAKFDVVDPNKAAKADDGKAGVDGKSGVENDPSAEKKTEKKPDLKPENAGPAAKVIDDTGGEGAGSSFPAQ